MEKEKRELIPINVHTFPNMSGGRSYIVKVFNNDYLYFSVIELIEGLTYHAGMSIVKEVDKHYIHEAVRKLSDGDTLLLMARNQDQQLEIADLKKQLAKVKTERQKLETKVTKLERHKEKLVKLLKKQQP